jgi:hypothetical protein
MAEIFQEGILRIMQSPIFFHTNLFTRYAKKAALDYNFQWISGDRCSCSSILAALYFGGFGMVGSSTFDRLSNL